MVCVTAGSPYYTPHAQRPAFFPPSDGYLPPHDPLVDVATMVAATARLARAHPDLTVVGSGLSYLQEWLPDVAQALVRDGSMAVAGIGRMVLSYPTLPADVLAGRPLVAGLALPDLQRLHDRPPTRPGVGLLPARRRLQAEPAAGRAHPRRSGPPRPDEDDADDDRDRRSRSR